MVPGFSAYDPFPTPVLVTNTRGLIAYLNPAFTRTTGYTNRDLVGKSPGVLSAGRTPARVYKKLWGTILAGKIWQGELQNRDKDGRVFLESIVIAPIKNSRGKILHFVASWQDITRRKLMEDRLKRSRRTLKDMSLRDALTGLYNRRGFFELTEHQILLSRRQKHPITLFYLDLNRFKEINDRFGHREGDRALIETAKLIRKTFRTSDIMARLGGDEFAIAAIDSKKEGLDRIARRLKANFERHNDTCRTKSLRIEYSLGSVVIKPDKSVNLESMLEKSDRLMYRQKNQKIRG